MVAAELDMCFVADLMIRIPIEDDVIALNICPALITAGLSLHRVYEDCQHQDDEGKACASVPYCSDDVHEGSI